ncbi:MAG: sodium:calcium antiporter, partial [Maioricimonas sp. JB049]
MLDYQISLEGDIAVFAVATIVIGFAGVKATALADRLADRSGMGEAVTGTIFLGFLTALPGLLASIVAAAKGHPAMAVSKAMGGNAVQTAALAVADIAYRPANLEHAAASVPNMMQATILIALMVLVLCGFSGPDVTVLHIHPVTLLLILAAGGAFRLVVATRDDPMWEPTETELTVTDEPDDAHKHESMTGLITGLVIAAGLTGVSGALVAGSASNIVEETGLSEVLVGALFVALATSLPELVTSVAAVRRGALTLAVSDIVGGNFFDVLFIAAADLVYLNGSIFHAGGIGSREIFLTSVTILLNIVLLAGLIFRQKQGPGNIGFESVL